MRLHLLIVALVCLCLRVSGKPSDHTFSPQDATQIYQIFRQGQRHKEDLHVEKQKLYDSINAFKTEHDEALYKLAGVKLDDFAALETLVFGMVDVYDNAVHSSSRAYDFRTPALKLTFDFQHAIRESHQRLRADSFDELNRLTESVPEPQEQHDATAQHYTPHHEHTEGDAPDSAEAMKELLHGMLQEVRQNADQLEDGMHRHNLQFGHEGATIETVLKLNDELNSDVSDESAVLIDQDNNEYIMTRPFDTTVIYEDMQLLHDFILIVVSSFGLGWIFEALGLPAFFGYILAGVITGPSGYNLIKELIQAETLAQLGVIFIVFVLGLEFSLEKLRSMWRLALGGAIMILAATVFLFVIMGAIIGASMKEAVFVGACVSLSSTAVVVKCIKSDHLEHLYGLLVMQDVLLGFMLAIIPALAKSGIQVFFAIVKIALSFTIFGVVCFALVKLMPLVPRAIRRAFPKKAIQHNHELMLLGTIAVCMVMLVVSEHLGLGMEIGCFAAGVIVRSRKGLFESSLAVIEPVRDLFACLFFASIGLHVYPSFLASEAMLLLTLAAGVIGFKYLVTSGILVILKLDLRQSSTMAIALAQISEFGFVLASRAKQLDIISREVYYLLLAVTSLTLLSTPLLWKLMNRTSLLSQSNNVNTSSTHLPLQQLPEDQHHHHHHHHHHPVVSIPLDDSDKIA